MRMSSSTPTLMLRRLWMLSAPFALTALQTACPGDPPVFPDPPVDAGIECSEEVTCPTGQVCLSGHCFASCTATSCGPNEMCGAMGACIPRPPVDAGPPDAFLPPDASLVCTRNCEEEEPFTPVCRFNLCFECQIAVDCAASSAGPVCNLGGGACTMQARAVCAPCDTDANCPAGNTCLSREVSGQAFERVCVAPCGAGGACEGGFVCETGNCVPAAGATCTGYHAAASTPMPQACLDASDCAPVGASILGIADNTQCNDGVCQLACTAPSQCPTALGFTTCAAGVCAR